MSISAVSSTPRLNPADYLKPALAVLLSVMIIAVVGGVPDLGIHAKVAFITFGLAIVGWTLTEINDTYIALAAAIVFAATGIDEPDEFFETLGDPLIWLMLASFMIAAAVKMSGLSERIALLVTRRARTVRQLFVLLTIVLIGTTFLVPSTSGRAALMLPVFLALRAVMPNERVARALSLLFPVIILLSAIASLVGAGAHLMTADILWRTGGEYLSFGRWLVMGLPFALASSFTAMAAIMFLFMNRSDRGEPIHLDGEAVAARKPWSRTELIVAGVVGALVILWVTETLHGVNSTLIALLGGLLLTAPMLNIISFKNALKEVDWGMLIFMAATLELGEALIESGGAQWLVDNLFMVFEGGIGDSPLASVTLVAGFGLLSHLVITSRSSRASVITPLVIFLATALGFSSTTFAFMTAAATGFCLTLPVSAKPVAMFAKVEGPTYSPRDLLKLSGALLPIHLVLLVVFAFFIWPTLGLNIAQAKPSEAPPAPKWSNRPERSLPYNAPLIDLGPNPYYGNKAPVVDERDRPPRPAETGAASLDESSTHPRDEDAAQPEGSDQPGSGEVATSNEQAEQTETGIDEAENNGETDTGDPAEDIQESSHNSSNPAQIASSPPQNNYQAATGGDHPPPPAEPVALQAPAPPAISSPSEEDGSSEEPEVETHAEGEAGSESD